MRAVGVLGADRRAPHHADQLVGVLRRVHQVLRELVAHRRERAGDRADQHADGRVGEDRVDDLAAAPVADRVAAVVDRVGDARGSRVSTGAARPASRRRGRAAGARPRSRGRRSGRRCRRRSNRRRRPRRAGGRARASRAAVSCSSSSPSTRITPNCRIAASTTASAPVSLPVWEAAVRAPVSVRPTLTATTGTLRAGGAVGGEEEACGRP